MQSFLLLISLAGCGYAAGRLIARPDTSRYVGAGAIVALGVVAIRRDAFWLFAVIVALALVGAIRGGQLRHRSRWVLYAPGKGGVDLTGHVTTSVKPPTNDNSGKG